MIDKNIINVIVPVYNEEKTIENVILNLGKIKFIDKVLVVNDASTDSTQKIISKYAKKFIILNNKINKGKGYCVAKALSSINNGLVVILDSDIIGYKRKHILDLCYPVIKNKVDFTLGTTKFKTYIQPKGNLSSLIGQRCYRLKDLKPLQRKIFKTTRYGFEMFLNKEFELKKHKLIYLKGTKHYTKFEKYTLIKALWSYVKEGVSILGQFIKDFRYDKIT